MAEATLNGEVLRVTFRSEENDWSVLVLRNPDRNGPPEIHCVGVTNAGPGQFVTATGKWTQRNGSPQFKADRITATNPTTPEGITAYLGSGTIAGIGQKKAAALVAAFGVDVLRVLDEEPDKLLSLIHI